MEKKFSVIIDEWDVLIRDEAANQTVQEEYIDFLRGLFKGSEPAKYIHLGYLGQDQDCHVAFIPNEEIRQELTAATKRSKWNEMITFQQESEKLLAATLNMDAETVAKEME